MPSRLALLAAVLAICAFAPSAFADPPTVSSPDCPTSDGPVRIDHLWARAPGGQWEDGLAKLCPFLHYADQPTPDGDNASYFSFSFEVKNTFDSDLSAVYPPGTEMSLELTSTAAA